MSVSMEGQFWSVLDELRYQRSLKRVRVSLAGSPVADSSEAVLVWEPRRVVPSWAIPERDIHAILQPATNTATDTSRRQVGFGDGPPVLDPSVPFQVHSAAGEPVDVSVDATVRSAAGFRFVDETLAGYVSFDFDAFDWLEEDEPIVGHPRDPFHRIDVRPTSRTIRLEHQGHVLAESAACQLLFEGVFPLVRYYFPVDDVVVPLEVSATTTVCAYKGVARHHSATVDGRKLDDIAWSYEHPLEDATRVQSMICFYHERLDLIVDGRSIERVRTPWSSTTPFDAAPGARA